MRFHKSLNFSVIDEETVKKVQNLSTKWETIFENYLSENSKKFSIYKEI